MQVEEFRNLVTNQFMPGFDYSFSRITFMTVFCISEFSYCCCMCGYEHEHLDYLSESGKVDEEMYQRIVKCINEGACPHVSQVMSSDSLEKTGIYALSIAAAVGTKQALKDHVKVYNGFGSEYCKSLLYKLGTFEMALMKNQNVSKLCAEIAITTFMELEIGKHLAVQRLSKDGPRVRLAFTTNLEACILKRNVHLVKKCLKYAGLGKDPAAVVNLTCKYKHELEDLECLIVKSTKRWKNLPLYSFTQFSIIPECCKITIIHNDCHLLEKILKSVPKHERKHLGFLHTICYVLQHKSCTDTLKRFNVPMETDMSLAVQVECLVSLLDYDHVRDKAVAALKLFPDLSDIVNSRFDSVNSGFDSGLSKTGVHNVRPICPGLDFDGTLLHYYIQRLTTLDQYQDYYCSYHSMAKGQNYCQVLRSIVNMEPRSISSMDGQGRTPLMYLLSQEARCIPIPIMRQIAETLIYENPDIEQEAKTVIYGIEKDEKMKKLGSRQYRRMFMNFYSYDFDIVIPDLNEGFLMDGQPHGLFGFDSQETFAFNFFVPLLMESGFPLSLEARGRLESENASLHPAENAYIVDYLETPRTLMLCCRNTLRKHFKGRQLLRFVEQSNVPEKIRDFILLKTLLKCTPTDLVSRCTSYINSWDAVKVY